MATIDELDAAAMSARAEWLMKLIDAVDALKSPEVVAVFEEFRELVDDLEAAEKADRRLDAAHACEELRDIFRGRGMSIAAERFQQKAKAHRYESLIRTRAKNRRERKR